ncbi:hypothetical protein R1sor_011186 [Riccia sorocarpa]|uniref:Alpha-carbonic anhydrase domain-containing protein n=1 Tax=Riccia sorocarpa TaxID=122646 RepID=A0ABD3I050_9MARC
MMSRQRLLVAFSISLLLAIFSSTADAYENLLKTKVDYFEDWDYGPGAHGPAHWGENWEICGVGKNQSPIDIDTSQLVYEEKLDAPILHSYTDENAYVFNNGHFPQVIWPAGWIYVDKKNYTMIGFQFHSPSEHTIDGKSHDIEMQILHVNEDGDYAIVVILSDVQDKVNGWVEQFWNKIPVANFWSPVDVGVLSPDGFRVNFSKYYRYTGSLTTPDCQENVVYSILSTVYEISPGQLEHLWNIFPNPTNRPVQPIGDRKVSYPKASL